MVEQTRDIKGILFLIGSRIFLSVGRLFKAKGTDPRPLITRWAIIPTEGLSRPLWIGSCTFTSQGM